MSSNTLTSMGRFLGSFRSADFLTWPPKSFALTLAQIMVFQEGLEWFYTPRPDRHNQAGSTQVPTCWVPPRIHPILLKSGKTSCIPFLPPCAPINTQPYTGVLRLAIAQAEGAWQPYLCGFARSLRNGFVRLTWNTLWIRRHSGGRCNFTALAPTMWSTSKGPINNGRSFFTPGPPCLMFFILSITMSPGLYTTSLRCLIACPCFRSFLAVQLPCISLLPSHSSQSLLQNQQPWAL